MRPIMRIIFLISVFLLAGKIGVAESKIIKCPIQDQFAILYEQDANSQITVIQIAIRGGKSAEPHLPGLAWLTTQMALEVQNQSDLVDLMTQGAVFRRNVLADFSLITLRCLSSKFSSTLELLQKSLLDPLINSLRLSAMKESMDFSRQLQQETPESIAALAQLGAFFQTGGYGASEFGSEASADEIKTADLKAFYKNYFVRENILISVCTDLPFTELRKILNPLVDKIPGGKRPAVAECSVSSPQSKPLFFKQENVQTLISSAWVLLGTSEKNFLMACLLKTLLGQGLGSRLWPLRSDLNLIYSLSANLTHLQNNSLLVVNLRTDDPKKELVLNAMQKILADLQQNGIGAEEFAHTQAYSASTFYRQYESKDEKSFLAIQLDILGLDLAIYTMFAEKLNIISLDEFNLYLKTVLEPQKQQLVIVGATDFSK